MGELGAQTLPLREEVRETPKKVNKSARTGRFVSNATVKKNPSTTYKETVKKSRGKKR